MGKREMLELNSSSANWARVEEDRDQRGGKRRETLVCGEGVDGCIDALVPAALKRSEGKEWRLLLPGFGARRVSKSRIGQRPGEGGRRKSSIPAREGSGLGCLLVRPQVPGVAVDY